MLEYLLVSIPILSLLLIGAVIGIFVLITIVSSSDSWITVKMSNAVDRGIRKQNIKQRKKLNEDCTEY